MGYDSRSIQTITSEQAPSLIAAYIHACANCQYTIKPGDLLSENTLSGYTQAAALWLRFTVPHLRTFSIGDPTNPSKLHPMVADTLAMRHKWREPKAKRQPYTEPMYLELHKRVMAAIKQHPSNMFTREACVYDWTRLGIFTGSRGVEYVQTTGNHTKWEAVPNNPCAGIWAGKPLAFIYSDFTLLQNSRVLTRKELLQPDCMPDSLQVRFRFDKSPTNFSIRKYKRTGHHIFCPVSAAHNIIRRAALLKVGEYEPLAHFIQNKKRSPYKGKTILLLSDDIIEVMRLMCRTVYPEDHIMHKLAHKVDCHSNRVTAAVALANAGLTVDEIAFRLRWKPASVEHYLRDCYNQIGKYCNSTIAGAQLI